MTTKLQKDQMNKKEKNISDLRFHTYIACFNQNQTEVLLLNWNQLLFVVPVYILFTISQYTKQSKSTANLPQYGFS